MHMLSILSGCKNKKKNGRIPSDIKVFCRLPDGCRTVQKGHRMRTIIGVKA